MVLFVGRGLKTWAREVLIQRGFSPFPEHPKPGNSTVSLNHSPLSLAAFCTALLPQ